MELTKQEMELMIFLIKNELNDVENREEEIRKLRPEVTFLAAEEKYEDVLEKLLKKIK